MGFLGDTMGICYLPPTQYDHEPTKPCTIKYGLYPRAYSQIGESGDHVIHLPSPAVKWMFYPRTSYKCLIRHEKGHINGWPASHPGMITVKWDDEKDSAVV